MKDLTFPLLYPKSPPRPSRQNNIIIDIHNRGQGALNAALTPAGVYVMNNLTVSVVGLGYVGLPVAVAFGQKHRTIGFDINPKRIKELKAGHDRTNEVADAMPAKVLVSVC